MALHFGKGTGKLQRTKIFSDKKYQLTEKKIVTGFF